MSDERAEVTQLRRALAAINELRLRLDSLEQARREPVAVIGMACRFPGGADTPQKFWELLANGVDGIREVPADRWDNRDLYDPDPNAAGKISTRWGGFIDSVDQFDPFFFGISPREAANMDPQQRLLLEVSWEALENAGQTMTGLAGSRAGVFVGVHSHSIDYYLMQLSDPAALDVYSGTGTAHNVIAGRVAYQLDLRGPCVAVDTACSSSLVAIHQAVQSLRQGESDLALCGGVNLMLSPEFSISASRMSMLAPDGRCKTFDARADGFVRSEGCGMVVLKRLSDAQRDGDPILALVRGSATNQDGRSNGLTAPNGQSQEAVIRAALDNGGLDASCLTYIEAHGTGTVLGDPIEVEAIANVLGARPDGPACYLGSAKANIGHLEGAAGVAGLIKAILSLQHRSLPPLLHFQQLNPHIRLEGTPLRIPQQALDWPAPPGRRFAGVSSFGWSGTNVHVVLEEAPDGPSAAPAPADSGADREFHLLPLSARSDEALLALAQAYRQRLEGDDAGLSDISYSAAVRRSHHEVRLAAFGRTAAEIAAALAAFAGGESHPQIAAGRADPNRPPGVVFVFPGQGGQWLGMGRGLLASDPAFRQMIERCEQAFRPHVSWSLLAQLNAGEQDSRLEEIDVVQPVLFAIQVALVESLRALGVVPDAVVGHSLGEVAAAYVCGALSLEDAAAVICTRSRLMRRVSGKGAMAVVGLTIEQTQALLANTRDRLSVGVSNSPTSTVLSGDQAALEEVLAGLRAQNIFCRPIKVDVAAHSPQMEALRPELEAALVNLRPQAAAIPLYSTVTGQPEPGEALGGAYWGRNLRQPVLFSKAVERLSADGYTVFIECGPHPVLLSAIGQIPQPESVAQTPRTLLAAMRRGEDEPAAIAGVLAGLYPAGYGLDWSRLTAGKLVPLPAYPWQHKRYWVQVRQDRFDPLLSWFYQVTWQPSPRPAEALPPNPGAWLVFCESGAGSRLGESLAERLAALGGQALRVTAGERFVRLASDFFQVNPRRAEDFHQLMAAVRSDGLELQGAAYLWGLDAPEAAALSLEALNRAQSAHLGGALHLAQALAGAGWPPASSPRVWIVTRSAQPVNGARPVGLAQAPLWGFGRVLAFEHPELWGGLIDLDDLPADVLASELGGPPDQQIAYRQGQRYAASLVRPASAPAPGAPILRPDASYLVTGGLGGLGLKVAAWLASQGARNLVLMGRSQGSEAARQAVLALEASGVRILRVQGDASREEDVHRILGEIAQSMPPLRGVIHAAGTVEDALLVRQDWPAFERVLASKVAGAWNLHRLTGDLPLDWFVFFSSASALLGTPSQANYAAANAFLDALAYERRAAGLPALSINWGAWEEVGLAAQQDRPAWLSRLGIEGFSPEKGLAALGRAFQQASPQATVLAMNWARFTAQRPGGTSSAFFSGLAQAEPGPAQADRASMAVSTITGQLEAAEPAARPALLAAHVHQTVAGVLRYENPASLSPDQGFFQLGMDSLMAVELKNRLQTSLGRHLRSTLAFDYPSVNLLSRYLLGELFPEQPAAAASASQADESLAEMEGLSRDQVKTMLDDELRLLEDDL
jgi:acyl transferase domain-containing protein